MIRSRASLAFVGAGLASLLALAGCGGGGSPGASVSASTVAARPPVAATVEMKKNSQLGPILTDSKGDTLYVFAKDSGGMSACSGSCAGAWPPLTTSGTPKAGNGAVASKLGTIKRSDGSTQVTYGGRPLYTYTADASPGDVTGNGVNSFGARWYAVQPSGSNAPAGTSGGGGSTGAPSSGTAGSSGGGYGY